MSELMRVVAVFTATPALTAILSATLAAVPGLRVRSFDARDELESYMQVAPVDLLVCDFDCEAAPAGELARALRRDSELARPNMQIIALTRKVGPHIGVIATMGGIDEVIAKPMSPKYLLERVVARLSWMSRDAEAALPGGMLQRRISRQGLVGRRWSGNVVPLFPERSPTVR
jgi:DNA-binding response OmpR family regulator